MVVMSQSARLHAEGPSAEARWGRCRGRARVPTMRNRLVALVIAAPLLAACGGGGSPSAGGADAPPWGLDSVAIPVDKASIIAAFEALPAEVAGLQRTRVDRCR